MQAGAATAPSLVDHQGRPMASAIRGQGAAHHAADHQRTETRHWAPMLSSPDVEVLPEWGDIVARTRDLIRNNGIASGAVQTHVDKVIGTNLRLSAKPDWRALGLSAEWADEWQRNVEAKWRQWADDVDCYCDARRRLTFSGLLAQGYRSYLSNNEMLATLEWLPRSKHHYATTVQMIAPERLSNPGDATDRDRLRGGVEMDEHGAPLAYHIRAGHPSEYWYDTVSNGRRWRRVPAETAWGRRQVIHVYDAEVGQTRGKSVFTSILPKAKMQDHWQKATLQAAVINAMYAAVIETSMGSPEIIAALGGSDAQSAISGFMDMQGAYHQGADIRFGSSGIAHLVPGEKLTLTAPQQPVAAFEQFEAAVNRHIAAGLNMSYEELTRDYTRTNYSSARASMLEGWRFFMGRRHHIAGRFATQVYAAWLEEAISRGDVEVPTGAPSFYEAKSAWTRCLWIGAPKGHIDELKEMKARTEALDQGTTTLEKLCMEQGEDWEEVMEQRAREERKRIQLGLPARVQRAANGAAARMDDPQPDDDPDAADRAERQELADA
ncbi:phage portal protein [Flagellatimonas centrodinii]|uniref:phage portal protein n=1 Tax=Flagellatimonas centrodinii TaxID=2806210 RepID=UPI001FED7BF8|nr:phage portal protein [Flagellatimonas centrodinii]ULQ45963.1 phage portal protein [Flagellatimonas centrodinii]